MSDFLSWSLEDIRNGGASMAWMESRRLEWLLLVASRLKYLLEGRAFILTCDEARSWYGTYFFQHINANRACPLLPFFSLKFLFGRRTQNNEDIILLSDMLEIAFPNGFVYFYIGTVRDKRSLITRSKSDSLLRLFDGQLQNNFYLDFNDKNLDSKLISLYKLFDKSLGAILFSKVSL